MLKLDHKEKNDSSDDKRVLLFIFGGIFIAFFIGLIFLLIAVFSDWQK